MLVAIEKGNLLGESKWLFLKKGTPPAYKLPIVSVLFLFQGFFHKNRNNRRKGQLINFISTPKPQDNACGYLIFFLQNYSI